MEKVLITGGNGDIAQALEKKLKGKYNVFALGREEMNLADINKCVEVIKTIKPDILINNAGFIKPQKIKNLYLHDLQQEFYINTIMPFFLSSQVLKHKKAKIINIGSTSGLKGRAEWGGYSASKAGIISLTETLQAEGHKAFIYNPRRTATKMRKSLFPNEDKTTLDTPEKVADDIIKLANL